MQIQAANRTFGGRFLIVVVALAILFGAALAALVADIVDRSDATASNTDRLIANPSNVTDAKSSAPPQEYLPEEATDAILRREQPNAYWHPGMGEGWISGNGYEAAPRITVVPYDETQFLEQNLDLPGDTSAQPSVQERQQQYWEREQPVEPETSTYDYRDWTSGQWTSGLTDR